MRLQTTGHAIGQATGTRPIPATATSVQSGSAPITWRAGCAGRLSRPSWPWSQDGRTQTRAAAAGALARLSGLIHPDSAPLFGHPPQLVVGVDGGAALRHPLRGTTRGYVDVILDDAALVACAALRRWGQPLAEDATWLHARGHTPERLIASAHAWLEHRGCARWLVEHLAGVRVPLGRAEMVQFGRRIVG